MGGMWVVSAKRVHSKSSSREAYGTSGTGGNCGFLEQAAIFKDRFTNSIIEFRHCSTLEVFYANYT